MRIGSIEKPTPVHFAKVTNIGAKRRASADSAPPGEYLPIFDHNGKSTR
jgi:hypothetical protein